MSATILIVDDDPVQRRLVESLVRRFGHTPVVLEGGEAAAALLTGPDGRGIDLVILDLVMPDLDGMGVLGRLREAEIATPVIVQTANGSIDAVVSAMRAGASDFVVKPVGPERLQVSIRNALKAGALEGELRRMTRKAAGRLTFRDLASKSPEMMRAVKLGERAAASTIPVLIEGQSGVGKELFARAVAGSSERAGKPFVAVNCGAIPANLVESILFGHEKGAFTGAGERHVGKFVEADGGTLFLDEVGELSLDTQVKLLRAIQEGEVDPVGARRPVKVDIRIVSATNRSLIDLVKDGRFREDLYYRLSVFPITIPPLVARGEDVADLARRFMARFAAEEGKAIRSIAPAALALLESYDWPGNVRQLENTVFRAVVLAEGDELTAEDFPQILQAMGAGGRLIPPALPAAGAVPAAAAPPALPAAAVPPAAAVSPALPAAAIPPADAPQGGPRAEPTRPAHALALIGDDGHVRELEALERDALRYAIERYGGQMTEVARRLGIGRSTLYRRLKDLDIAADPAGERDADATGGTDRAA